MEKLIYNKDLANRFVSDYKLPIPITFVEDYFFYYLNLYEEDYNSMTNYMKLCELINEKYESKPEKFLEDYYNVREDIIQTMLNNEAYKTFNTMDMSCFTIKNRPQVSSNNVYNCENNGKLFLSIDLKKANFQTLKYINKDIVLNANTYEDFIGKFTDLDYIKQSKYTRQVVFGKLNPKRHITAEKFLINKVYELIDKLYSYKAVSVSNDEIVYDVTNIVNSDNRLEIKDTIKNVLGLNVSVEYYCLECYQLLFKKTKSISKTFFYRKSLFDHKENKLVSVPLPFYPIVYSLFKGRELTEIDYHFNYEGMDAVINEEFEIKKY